MIFFFLNVFVFMSKEEDLESAVKIKKTRLKAKKEEVLEKPVEEVERGQQEDLEPAVKIKKARVKTKKEEVLEKPVEEVERGQQEDLEPAVKIKKTRVKAKKEEVSVSSTKKKVYDYNMRRDWALAYAKYKQMYFSVWWKSDQDFINELFAKPSEAEHSPLWGLLFDSAGNEKIISIPQFVVEAPPTKRLGLLALLESLNEFMSSRSLVVKLPLRERADVVFMYGFFYFFLFACFVWLKRTNMLDRYDDEFLFTYPSSRWAIEEEPWDDADRTFLSADHPVNVIWQRREDIRRAAELSANSMDEAEGVFFGEPLAFNCFLDGSLDVAPESKNGLLKDFQCDMAEVVDESRGSLYLSEYKGASSSTPEGDTEVKSEKDLVNKELIQRNEFNLDKEDIRKIALETAKPMDEQAWWGSPEVTHPLYLHVSTQDMRSAHAHKLPSGEEANRIKYLKMLEERGGNEWYDDEFLQQFPDSHWSEGGEEAEDDNINSYYGYSDTEPDQEYFDKRRKELKLIKEKDGKLDFGYKSTLKVQLDDDESSSFEDDDDDFWGSPKPKRKKQGKKEESLDLDDKYKKIKLKVHDIVDEEYKKDEFLDLDDKYKKIKLKVHDIVDEEYKKNSTKKGT